MTILFTIGGVLGLILLIVEAIRNQWALRSWEGVFAFIVYPLFCGWGLCFIWKIIQWPFL